MHSATIAPAPQTTQTTFASRYDARDPLAPLAVRSSAVVEPDDPLALGPLKKVYLIWLGGASCEGCTVSVTGATHPKVEQLLAGAIPGLPRVELIHGLLSTESGAEWIANLLMAERGELDAPYILTWEGSVLDESAAGAGSWSGLGQDPLTGRQVTTSEWLDRLAPGAAAVIAVGTCAAWGGIPAAVGNPTGARGLTDHLGETFRSAAGVPVVNIPGCAPLGDNYTETVAALLLHLNGLAPLPELDDLGRPAWLFTDTVHSSCNRLRYYEEGVFSTEAGGPACLVELGCWGPVVQCNIAERGAIDGHGGCMTMGGICIGCTMPGFPDRFAPLFETPVFDASAGSSRAPGGFLRRIRSVRVHRSPSRTRRPPAVAVPATPRFYRATARDGSA
jgi:hydrogenase small subunit